MTGITTVSGGFIRGIELRRRRSRVPWIYSLYHAAKPARREARRPMPR
jgi:hypothetical protein